MSNIARPVYQLVSTVTGYKTSDGFSLHTGGVAMKTYKITANVDGVTIEVYKDAPDTDTATRDVCDDLTLGAIESPELVTILDVELLDDNNIYQIKKEDAKYIVF